MREINIKRNFKITYIADSEKGLTLWASQAEFFPEPPEIKKNSPRSIFLYLSWVSKYGCFFSMSTVFLIRKERKWKKKGYYVYLFQQRKVDKQ